MQKTWLVKKIVGNFIFWSILTKLHSNGNWHLYPHLFILLIASYGIAAYIHNYFLIPKIVQRKYVVYAGLTSLLLVVSTVIAYLLHTLVNHFYPTIDLLSYANKNSITYHFFIALLTFVMLAFGKLMSDSIETQIKLETLQKQRLESELSVLRSQIHPHFIFNSLNTIYGMIRRTDTEAADAVIKLSDILRHSIYECQEPYISLDKEIRLIEQYVSFTSLRIKNKNALSLNIQTNGHNLTIAPLLLLPFIENAIKHGLYWEPDLSWVKINLFVNGNILLFECGNSNYGTHEKTDADYNGIGLANVKRRLELLYPAKHDLSIQKDDTTYMVALKIDLQ